MPNIELVAPTARDTKAVAAAVGSLPEVVDAPRGGVLVPPEDPEALAAATTKLLDDPYGRSTLSITARESARRFSWSAVAEAHLAFINNIASGGYLPASS